MICDDLPPLALCFRSLEFSCCFLAVKSLPMPMHRYRSVVEILWRRAADNTSIANPYSSMIETPWAGRGVGTCDAGQQIPLPSESAHPNRCEQDLALEPAAQDRKSHFHPSQPIRTSVSRTWCRSLRRRTANPTSIRTSVMPLHRYSRMVQILGHAENAAVLRPRISTCRTATYSFSKKVYISRHI